MYPHNSEAAAPCLLGYHPHQIAYYIPYPSHHAPSSTCYPPPLTYYHPPGPSYLYPLQHLTLQLCNLDLYKPTNQEPQSVPRRRSIKSASEFDESSLGVDEIRTTVMIKNIPNKLSREMLIEMLDQHCAQENCKAEFDGSPLSEYDFVYLPMDFGNKCNLGYAFVNFTTAIAGWRLYRAMHNCKWAVFGSRKISHICYARIQGKQALVENFKRSYFPCNNEEYLPAVLSPPRNGTTSCTAPAAVGLCSVLSNWNI